MCSDDAESLLHQQSSQDSTGSSFSQSAAGASGGSQLAGQKEMSKDLADPSDVECPVRSNSRLLGNILEVPERGLTLREAGSVLLGTMQDPELVQLLQDDELGLSNFRLLNDSEFYKLYEWAFDYPTGFLGPGGGHGYSFKDSLLDRPSQLVTAAARKFLAWALEELDDLKGDSSKLRNTTGWSPTYTFETMLDEMIEYWMTVL
jgi:hypothetical protein